MNTTLISAGFPGLLFLVFLTLKLTGSIAWSWWWVTAPLWGPSALVVLVSAVCFVAAFAIHYLRGRRS